MAEYLVFVRIEPAHIKGKGADRGEVVSIRPGNARFTRTEKKRLLILKVEMDDIQLMDFKSQLWPRQTFEKVSAPPKGASRAEKGKFYARMRAIPQRGLKVDIGKLKKGLASETAGRVDDLTKAVEPMAVPYDTIEAV